MNGNNCEAFVIMRDRNSSRRDFGSNQAIFILIDECIYDADEVKRVQYVIDHGHQIGSHTWSHPVSGNYFEFWQPSRNTNMYTSSDRILRRSLSTTVRISLSRSPQIKSYLYLLVHNEMWLIEQALERIVGLAPAFMRPPFGNYNNLVRQVAAQRNQSLALWDLDTEDVRTRLHDLKALRPTDLACLHLEQSLGASVATSEQIYAAAVAKNPKNILALNHEPYDTTAHQVLPYAIKLLQSKGYKLVTLAECLNKPAYQWTTARGQRTVSVIFSCPFVGWNADGLVYC